MRGHSLANQRDVGLKPGKAPHLTKLTPSSFKNIMNISLLPFALVATLPAFVLIGLGIPSAIGLITVMGTLAMLVRDYNSELAYQRELSPLRVREALPLAA